MMLLRLIERMLFFVIAILSGEFEEMRTYMLQEIETGKGQWIKMVNQYRNTLGIDWEEMKEMEKKDLKKIREYDTKIWKEGLENKETLKWYKKGKKSIGYEMCYNNNINSSYLAKARTNSLQLEDHLSRGNRE